MFHRSKDYNQNRIDLEGSLFPDFPANLSPLVMCLFEEGVIMLREEEMIISLLEETFHYTHPPM